MKFVRLSSNFPVTKVENNLKKSQLLQRWR